MCWQGSASRMKYLGGLSAIWSIKDLIRAKPWSLANKARLGSALRAFKSSQSQVLSTYGRLATITS